jgi:hypothetical protein
MWLSAVALRADDACSSCNGDEWREGDCQVRFAEGKPFKVTRHRGKWTIGSREKNWKGHVRLPQTTRYVSCCLALGPRSRAERLKAAVVDLVCLCGWPGTYEIDKVLPFFYTQKNIKQRLCWGEVQQVRKVRHLQYIIGSYLSYHIVEYLWLMGWF